MNILGTISTARSVHNEGPTHSSVIKIVYPTTYLRAETDIDSGSLKWV